MTELELRRGYIEYANDELKIFDLIKFMFDDNIVVDNGAIGIITPNQMIFVRNLPKEGNNKPGSGNHYDTYDILTKVIYELPLDNRIFARGSKELEYYVERNFDIKNGQNIFIRMINEGNKKKHMRAICIQFPIKITTSQLVFLKFIEEKYGELLKLTGDKMVRNGEEPLIFFQKKNRENVYCNSFLPAIEYAEDFLIDDVKQVIKEIHIIGITVNDIMKYKKDKQI